MRVPRSRLIRRLVPAGRQPSGRTDAIRNEASGFAELRREIPGISEKRSVTMAVHDRADEPSAASIVGALSLVSGLIHLAILPIGGGSWQGTLSLRKPMTFGLSFGLTLITIVWVASFLRLSDRARVMLLGAFTVACALETALVTLQAWRGVPSHSTWKRRMTRRCAHA
jgi:hypothetical protein